MEAITNTIHEFMNEKMNKSRDSEEETNFKHLDRKRNYLEPEKEKPNKFRKVDCMRCGAPNWNKQHDCLAKTKKCLFKLREIWSLCKTVPNQRKIGPEGKTHLSGIRSNNEKLTIGHQTKHTSKQERSIQGNKDAKTDNHSSPQRHWSTTVQSNSSLTADHR